MALIQINQKAPFNERIFDTSFTTPWDDSLSDNLHTPPTNWTMPLATHGGARPMFGVIRTRSALNHLHGGDDCPAPPALPAAWSS